MSAVQKKNKKQQLIKSPNCFGFKVHVPPQSSSSHLSTQECSYVLEKGSCHEFTYINLLLLYHYDQQQREKFQFSRSRTINVKDMPFNFHFRMMFLTCKAEVGSLFLVSLSKNSIITFQHIAIRWSEKTLDFCTSPWFSTETVMGLFSSSGVISDSV